MQDGSSVATVAPGASQSESSLESQPQPRPCRGGDGVWFVLYMGLSPVKPSSVPDANSMCPDQLGTGLCSNVLSDTAKVVARASRFGI